MHFLSLICFNYVHDMAEQDEELSSELYCCPICQVPFKILKIDFSLHINMCDINWTNLEECKDGIECTSESLFHYRDYSHQILANHRENMLSKRKWNETKSEEKKKKKIKLTANRSHGRKKQNRSYYMPEKEDEDDIFMEIKTKKETSGKNVIKSGISDVKSKSNQCSIKYSYDVPKNENVFKENSFGSEKFENENVYDLSTDVDDNASDSSTKSTTNCDNIIDTTAEADIMVETILSKSIDIVCEKKEKCKARWNDIFKNSKKIESSSLSKSEVKIELKSTNKLEKKPKVCPSYKKMPGTAFAVDAFQYGSLPDITAYFLSHFHSDHYIGLKKSFSHPLYCSLITANLVKKKLRVDEQFIKVMELNQPMIINNVEVTCFDANHCPGSILILFRLLNGDQYLHVGDFRASLEMEEEPELRRACITRLYLDTTYFDPQYVFPSQKDVIDRVKKIAREMVLKYPKALFVSGSYLIGKEKVFLGILDELKCKLWAQPPKRDVFRCINNEKILSVLTDNPNEARVHVLPMNYLRFDRLKNHLSNYSSFSHVFAFKPTGWEMGRTKINNWINTSSYENITIYGVPYSEHSNYEELCRFIRFIKADKVIPTVPMKNREMWSHLKHIVDTYREESHLIKSKQQKMDYYMTSK